MYGYWCTKKAPDVGAIPKGAISAERAEGYVEDLGGHIVYIMGVVWYNRELTDKEVEQYELLPM